MDDFGNSLTTITCHCAMYYAVLWVISMSPYGGFARYDDYAEGYDV